MINPLEKRRTLFFVCLVMFLDAVGFGLIIPVLPNLIQELSTLDNSHSAEIAGYLLFTFAAMQFFFAPLLGGLSDRFGRRPVLLLALLGFAVDYFIMAIAPTLFWLFAARIASGLFGATFAAANACIVDISDKAERAKYFGMTGAAVGLGFVFGPVLGGLIGEYGTRLPFIAAGILTGLTLIYGYFALPETLAPPNRRRFDLSRANPIGSLIVIWKYPVVLAVLCAVFFVQFANQSYASIWSFYTIAVADWTPLFIGLSIAFYGIMLAIVQGGLTGPVIKAFGEVKAVYFSIGVGIVSFLGLAFATSGWHIYLSIFIGGMSGFAFPAMQSIMTSRIPQDAQGELQGAIMSTYSITAIVGPIAMSQMFGAFTRGDGPYLPGAPFVLASLLIVCAMLAFTLGIHRMSLEAKRSHRTRH